MKSELYLSNIFKSIHSEMYIILIAYSSFFFFFFIGKLENTHSLRHVYFDLWKSESFPKFPSRVYRIDKKIKLLKFVCKW